MWNSVEWSEQGKLMSSVFRCSLGCSWLEKLDELVPWLFIYFLQCFVLEKIWLNCDVCHSLFSPTFLSDFPACLLQRNSKKYPTLKIHLCADSVRWDEKKAWIYETKNLLTKTRGWLIKGRALDCSFLFLHLSSSFCFLLLFFCSDWLLWLMLDCVCILSLSYLSFFLFLSLVMVMRWYWW